MAFFESPRFPLSVANGAGGGPEFNTDVATVKSGYEFRNANWPTPRRRYNAALGVKTIANVETLTAFFNTAQGKFNGFRFKDLADYKSCPVANSIANTDQIIGTGDGVNRVFQLKKTYQSGSNTLAFNVKKPVSGTTIIAVNGVSSAVWAVDTTTGIVTFTPGNAPAAAAVVTAGYEYDVPVRFDTDFLDVRLLLVTLGAMDVPLVEIKV